MEGTIRDRQLAEVMLVLAERRATGILTVQGSEEIIALSLLAGEIVSADALNQTLEAGLGQVLSRMGLVSPADFAGLVAEYQAGGGRVVDLLEERSLVSRDQLLEALRVHTQRLSFEVLGWGDGEYRFFEGDEVAHEKGVEPLEIDEVLVRAAQDLGAAGPLGGSPPHLEEVYAPSAALGPDGARDELLRQAAAGHGPAAVRVIELLDGRRTVSELVADSGETVYRVQLLLARWREAGLVTTAADAVPAAAVAAPAAGASVLELELEPLEAAPVEPPEEPAPVTVARQVAMPQPWPARLLALSFLALLGVAAAQQPTRFLLPFPWQSGLMGDFGRVQTALVQARIDAGARTFFLLHGRFPDSLEQLAERQLILERDRFDARGRPLRIAAAPASFSLQVAAEEGGTTGSIAGNFLLDPEFDLPAGAVTRGPPLVLLD